MIRLTMKPAPPVTRYTFEPLVIIWTKIERLWDLENLIHRRAYLTHEYGLFERIVLIPEIIA